MTSFLIQARCLCQGSRLVLKQNKLNGKNLPKRQPLYRYNKNHSLRKSNKPQGISPDSDLAQHWSLSTDVDEIKHASYQQTENTLITGEDIESIDSGMPGEIGCMPPNPRAYDDGVSGVDAADWRGSMAEERWSLIEHDAFEWVDPPDDIQAIPARLLFRWKYDQGGVACPQM